MEDAKKKEDTVPVAGTELVIERLFHAPRDLVWQAWTEPERLMQWWGPSDFTMTVVKLDLRPGGIFHYGLRSLDGHEVWGRFTYVDVAAPEKLIFINSFTDESGAVTRSSQHAAWPLEVFNICTFSASAQRTLLSMKGRPHNATAQERKTFAENRDTVKKGFTATFDQLDRYLAAIRL